MKKKQIINVVVLTLVAIIAAFGFYKLFSSNINVSQFGTLPTPTIAVNRSITFNDNGYLTYLIEGQVESVANTKPLTINILVKTEKILSDYTEPLIKTITLEEGSDFIFRELATNKEVISMDYDSIKQGDDIVAWLVEPNTKLLELEKFAATKIIINR